MKNSKWLLPEENFGWALRAITLNAITVFCKQWLEFCDLFVDFIALVGRFVFLLVIVSIFPISFPLRAFIQLRSIENHRKKVQKDYDEWMQSDSTGF